MSLKHSKHLSSWEESIYDSKQSIKCRVTTSLTSIISSEFRQNFDFNNTEIFGKIYLPSLFGCSLLQDFKSCKVCDCCWLIMWTNCLLVDNFNTGFSLAKCLTPGCDWNIDKVRGGEWPGPGWAWWTPQSEFCKLCWREISTAACSAQPPS